MDDETKKIRGHVERLYTCAVRLNSMARHADDGMVDSAIAADNQRSLRIVADAILAHIDGEPERLAAKAEEQREACARLVGEGVHVYPRGSQWADEERTRDRCVAVLAKYPEGKR